MNIFYEVGATFVIWTLEAYLIAFAFAIVFVGAVMVLILLKHYIPKVADWLTSFIK